MAKVKEVEKEIKKSTTQSEQAKLVRKKVIKVKNAVEIIDNENVIETTIITEEIPKGLEKKVDLFLTKII